MDELNTHLKREAGIEDDDDGDGTTGDIMDYLPRDTG